MKKTSLALILIINTILTAPSFATTPKNVLQAGKALVTIVTYDSKDNILHSTNGFYITSKGEVLSDYEAFKDASKAIIISGNGTKTPVARICGANDIYNLIKVTTQKTYKDAATITSIPAALNETCYILVPQGKKSITIEAKISNTEIVKNGNYYTLNIPYKEQYISCPLVNGNGEVFAIIQKSDAKNDGKTYAISANTGTSLKINAFSFSSQTLRSINIPKQIPDNEKDASTYIFLIGQTQSDSLSCLTALNDFIDAYPLNADGYMERAKFYGKYRIYKECANDISLAAQHSTQKDLPHYTFSRIIYQNALYNSFFKDSTTWSLDKALQEANLAYDNNPMPLYTLQQGYCYYGMKQYPQALEKFNAVNLTDLASSETFFYAAKAMGKMEKPAEEIIPLLDSAIVRFTPPYTKAVAPYFWERAQYLSKAEKYREAVLDLNEYEHIIGFNNLNDKFYYMREQAAMESKLYQQAVEDINRCVTLQPNNYLYKIEKSALLIQVGQLDEAILTARQAIQLEPEDSDGYKMLGVAYGEKKNKKAAIENLKKAQSLGDSTTDKLIEIYGK